MVLSWKIGCEARHVVAQWWTSYKWSAKSLHAFNRENTMNLVSFGFFGANRCGYYTRSPHASIGGIQKPSLFSVEVDLATACLHGTIQTGKNYEPRRSERQIDLVNTRAHVKYASIGIIDKPSSFRSK